MAELFIGRQPVFDSDQNVWGYELLFRSSTENNASFENAQAATSQVILNALLEFGLERVVGDARALVNLPKDFLLGQQADLLPPHQVVLEILEDVEVDEDVVNGARRLREMGYTIALDDFAFEPRWEPLMDMADLIKVEVPAIPPDKLESLRRQFRTLKERGVRLLAEKVETHEQFDAYKTLGFDYFQGYFFSRPNVMQSSRIPTSRTQILRLLSELNRADVEVKSLEALVKTNVDLSYKLLRFVNSARYALAREVVSVRDALVLVGTRQMRVLAGMVAMSGVDDKPTELVELSLFRAKLCERLAVVSGHENPEMAFTVGMLSTLDALLDRPLAEVVSELPLTEQMREALLDREGECGRILTWTIAFEQANWGELDDSGLAASDISPLYLESLTWARETLEELTKP